jgi:hypothetical protein
MSNTTNVTGLNSSLSYHHAQANVSAQRLSTDTANNLGYGVGKIVRNVFDSFWNSWQKMWTPEPSAVEIAERRNYKMYEGGLKKCVEGLGPALANLQMNPKDPGALKKVEQVSEHFAHYLEPSREENFRELQSRILKPLAERVSALARLHMKNLSQWMPVFFQGNSKVLTAPTCAPTNAPTRNPTPVPTRSPTSVPTCMPITTPTLTPTDFPTSLPTDEPTSTPTDSPTGLPTNEPTTIPTLSPTDSPTGLPTNEPTTIPTLTPTNSPTGFPTNAPTGTPILTPTNEPTSLPTNAPTIIPTLTPTNAPTSIPIGLPTIIPTGLPTEEPTSTPTSAPTSGIKDTGLLAVLGCVVGLLIIVVGIGIYRFKKKEKEEEKPGRLLINTDD